MLGFLHGAAGMWAAWGENSNEETCRYTTGEINWSEWLPLGFCGLLILGFPPLMLTTIVAWVAGRLSKARQ